MCKSHLFVATDLALMRLTKIQNSSPCQVRRQTEAGQSLCGLGLTPVLVDILDLKRIV